MKTEAQREKELIRAIFGDIPLGKCDCDTCPYIKECGRDNPDFDANHCLTN